MWIFCADSTALTKVRNLLFQLVKALKTVGQYEVTAIDYRSVIVNESLCIVFIREGGRIILSCVSIVQEMRRLHEMRPCSLLELSGQIHILYTFSSFRSKISV